MGIVVGRANGIGLRLRLTTMTGRTQKLDAPVSITTSGRKGAWTQPHSHRAVVMACPMKAVHHPANPMTKVNKKTKWDTRGVKSRPPFPRGGILVGESGVSLESTVRFCMGCNLRVDWPRGLARMREDWAENYGWRDERADGRKNTNPQEKSNFEFWVRLSRRLADGNDRLTEILQKFLPATRRGGQRRNARLGREWVSERCCHPFSLTLQTTRRRSPSPAVRPSVDNQKPRSLLSPTMAYYRTTYTSVRIEWD